MEKLSLSRRLELGPLPLDEAMRVMAKVAQSVSDWHARGLLHRELSPTSILLGASTEEIGLEEPSPEPVVLGGPQWDPDNSPVELSTGGPYALPRGLAEARDAFAAANLKLDPTQVDFYQLGALLIRLLTGESVTAYLSSPKTKSRIPETWRSLLDRTLGCSREGRVQSAAEIAQAFLRYQLPTQVAGDTVPTEHAPATDEQPLPVARVGEYELRGRIGRGGMGDVYEGYDTRLDRTVAVKMLPDELSRHTDFVRRFYAEAASAARLVHPNIIEILYVGEEAGRHFFVMEYIAGESLAERLNRQKFLSVEEAVSITLQVLSALGAAHDEGFVHRDIKPGNILLESAQRRAVLADFGLVKSLQEATGLTATGVVVGTVQYMSPEQARGRMVDGRSDLYSLGVLLYQMLSGELPFTATGTTALIYQHVYEPPRPLIEVAPTISPVLGVIVDKLLAKAPNDRYAAAAIVAADLQAYLDQQPLPSGADIVESDQEGDAEPDDWSPTDATLIITAPQLDPIAVITIPEPPPEPAPAPLEGTWWDRWQHRLWEAVREQAPEFAASLQTTEEQLESSLADYERRQQTLQQLTRKALRLLQELRQRRADWQSAAERATDDDERQRCQSQLSDLSEQITAQLEQLSEMRLQQAKVSATLERMRSQKDILQARLKVVETSLKLSGWKRRRRLVRSCVALTALLVVVALLWMAYDGRAMLRAVNEASTREIALAQQDETLQPLPIAMPHETYDLPDLKLRDVDANVDAVAFSPDGQRLYLGMDNDRLGVWDLKTGRREGDRRISWAERRKGFFQGFSGLMTLPESGQVVSWSRPMADDDTMRVWPADSQTDSQAYPFKGLDRVLPTAAAREVLVLSKGASAREPLKLDLFDLPSQTVLRTLSADVLSADAAAGVTAFIGKSTGSLHVWSIPDRTETRVIPKVVTPYSTSVLKLSHDGRWAAIVSSPPRVSIWNLSTGALEFTQAARGQSIQDFAFQPQTGFLAIATEKNIELWEIPHRRVRKLFQSNGLRKIRFSPDGTQLVGFDGSALGTVVVLWDATPGILATTGNARTLKGDGPAVLSADGVAYVSMDKTDLVLRSLSDERELQRVPFGVPVSAVALSPDAAYAVAVIRFSDLTTDSDLHLLDLSARTRLRTLKGHSQVEFAPDSRTLYFVQGSDLMKCEMPSGNVTRVAEQIIGFNELIGLAVSPRHEQVAIMGKTDDYAQFLSFVDLKSPQSPRHPSDTSEKWVTLSYLPDGMTIAAVAARDVIFYDAASLQETHRFHIGIGTEIGNPVAFTPDGMTFALGYNQLGLCSARTGKVTTLFEQPKSGEDRGWLRFNHLRFTPDGRYLFHAHGSKPILLYDTQAASAPQGN
jgi:serine/threonine protein kinase/WD40 repeat protein